MKRKGLLILAVAVVSGSVEARWAKPEDAASSNEREEAVYTIRKDGRYHAVFERRVKLLKEGARTGYGVTRLNYNSRTASLKVIEAATHLGERIIPVRGEFIEDKPLASSGPGFDQINQVMIAFPEAEVGAELRIKYEMEVREPAVEGLFSESFVFGWNQLEKKSRVVLRSEAPLVLGVHDPGSDLRVDRKGKDQDGFHIVEIVNRRPVFKSAVEESGIRYSGEMFPWVDVSTVASWKEVADRVSGDYERVIAQPLPKEFRSILEKAKKKKNDVDRINEVTSLLSERVHYLGDWRPVRGGFVPRDLEMIARTRFGDCKDYSVVTAAILRALGMKAHVAWVKRDRSPVLSPNRDIPVLGAFNHAIVHVEDASGKGADRWIDPTNFTSFAQGVYEDIVDRPVLVLRKVVRTPSVSGPVSSSAAGVGGLAMIRAGRPEEAVARVERRVRVPSRDRMEASGRIELRGRGAVPVTGAQLRLSKANLDYWLISLVGDQDRMEDWSVSGYKLKSRVVRDVDVRFKYREKDTLVSTSAGPAIRRPMNNLVQSLLVKTAGRVSNLFLGQPRVLEKEDLFEGIAIVGDEKLDCQVESPWLRAEREVKRDPNGVVRVKDRLVLKVAEIPNRELLSKKYRAFQGELNRCMNELALVLRI